MNPFRKETFRAADQPKYVDIDKLDSVYGDPNSRNNGGFNYSLNENTRAGDTTDDFDPTQTGDDLGPQFYPNSPIIGQRDKNMKTHALSNISNNRGDVNRNSNLSKSLLSSTQMASADYGGKLSMRIRELKKIKMSKYGK